MRSIAPLIEDAAAALAAAGVAEARREAASLMQIAIDRPRSFIIAHPEYVPDGAESNRFSELVKRRCGHEPFHHLTGKKEFFGLDFIVSPDVLIPRPETEMLVEQAIEVLKNLPQPRFCEVGVGSGCISVSILHNLGRATATGLEISPEAIAVATENSSLHRVNDRFDIFPSDVFAALGRAEKFDLVVSNPPYIPAADVLGLQPEVRDHEPLNALTDGADGLSIIRRLVDESPDHLKPGGTLMFEFGFGQSDAVRAMFPPKIWRDVSISDDLQGIPRTIAAKTANH